MTVKKYRSFWKIILDAGGGTDVPDDTDITPDTGGWTPPDVGRDVITANTGQHANERVLGKLTDMGAVVILNSNYHQMAGVNKSFEFEVEEDLVSNDPATPDGLVTYSVVGRLQLRSLGAASPDNSARPCTLTFLVDAYTEKHSDQSVNAYQIDLRTKPQIFKQNGMDMFPKAGGPG